MSDNCHILREIVLGFSLEAVDPFSVDETRLAVRSQII
jgi:hypothetical protein